MSGVVKNFNNEVKIEDISENQDLKLLTSKLSFLPDSNGHFSTSFHIDKPNYFKIGRNILFFSPGTNLVVYIDYNRPDSARFSGGNSQENTYLKSTPFPFMGSFLEGGDNVKSTINETLKEVLKISQIKKSRLSKFKNISSEFRILELNRIKSDIINSLQYLSFYYPLVQKVEGDSLVVFQKKYQDSAVPYIKKLSKNFLNRNFLKLQVYRNILGNIMKYSTSPNEEVAAISDWLGAKDLVQEMKSINEKENIFSFKNKISTIRNAGYRKLVFETFNEFLTFNGDNAIDFEMADSSGTNINLTGFKGKIIFIDLWATWCGPCMEEKPFMESLIKYYYNNPNVKILSVSIDGDKVAWKKHLKTKNYQGMQLIVDRAKLDAYHVSEIPRTIIINKNFKIAAMRGPKPSGIDTKRIIDSLLEN